MTIIRKEGAPFFFKRGKIGCLLVHGFTGAPKEMIWLGEQLALRDYTTLGVRLFAHGTNQNDMLRARWRDWYLSVVDGYHLLSGCCEDIFVMGLSMGGVLAFLLGSQFPVTGIAALSTPFFVPDARVIMLRPLIPLVSTFWKFASKGESDWVDPEANKDHFEYPGYPLKGANELHFLLKEMQERLPSVTAPVLIIHSKRDRSVSEEHPEKIFKNLKTKHKSILWLDNSGHVITLDAEKDRVFQAVADFIESVVAHKDM